MLGMDSRMQWKRVVFNTDSRSPARLIRFRRNFSTESKLLTIRAFQAISSLDFSPILLKMGLDEDLPYIRRDLITTKFKILA